MLKDSELESVQDKRHAALMTQVAIATGCPDLLDVWAEYLGASAAPKLAELPASLSDLAWYQAAPSRTQLAGALEAYARSPGAGLEGIRDFATLARRYSFRRPCPRAWW
jgi:hypothetical protein